MHTIFKNKISIIILIAILSPAILLYSLTPGPLPRFSDTLSALASTGELAGILGVILFSFTLILSARTKFLEKIFFGLNNLYAWHSKIGQVAFILLLAHPLLLLARYATSLESAARFFSLTNNWQQTFGILSLYLAIIVIILTLYLRPKYHIWKQIHKLLGVSLFLGALHIYLSPSYVLDHNILLNIYVLGFTIVGILLWLYKSIFGKTLSSMYNYTVKNITHLNKNTIEIELQTEEKTLTYSPGQFVFVTFLQKNLPKESHPLSVISNANNRIIKVAIKTLGDYTELIYNRLEIWTPTLIEGPFGFFSYTKNKKGRQIWIAGGIGVTPFISMAKDLSQNKFYNVDMYYAVKNEEEAIYLEELQTIASQIDTFKVMPFYSDTKGFITAKYITKHTDDALERDMLICAPPQMIWALKKQFINMDVKPQNLYSEELNF